MISWACKKWGPWSLGSHTYAADDHSQCAFSWAHVDIAMSQPPEGSMHDLLFVTVYIGELINAVICACFIF